MDQRYIIAGLVLFVLMRTKATASISTAGAATSPTSDFGPADDFERPNWGANWISNQWAMVMQGQAAHTGQIRAGGYL